MADTQNFGRQMKRGILLATMMVAAAGVASANLLTTAPESPAPSPSRAQAATPTPPVVARVTPTAPAPSAAQPVTIKVAAAPTTQKSAVEVRQAPVPLQVKPRPPINVPAVDTKPGEAPGEQPLADEAAGEKAAARAAIEADGYKGVKVLRKGANGVWHASALRGNTTVMLTVDSGGSVSAD